MFRPWFPKKPAVLEASTPLSDRLINRLNYYLAHELPKVLNATGKLRVRELKRALTSLSPELKADQYLVNLIAALLFQPYGVGFLGKSKKLRMRLFYTLGEHLGVAKEKIDGAVNGATVGVDLRAVSEAMLYNMEFSAAYDCLHAVSSVRPTKEHLDVISGALVAAKNDIANEGSDVFVAMR